ncbi:MAG: polysaccharide deacetylase [Butyrivibrio sp.]|nr:polysaccharide deacetylase [Butyrivibrio sp.]
MASNKEVRNNRNSQRNNSPRNHDIKCGCNGTCIQIQHDAESEKAGGQHHMPVGLAAVTVLAAVCFCIFFGISYFNTVGLLKDTKNNLKWYQERYGDRNAASAASSEASSETGSVAASTSGSSDRSGNVRKVYLTFDDGPSTMTDRILDVLDRYHVKATFFVVGKTDSSYQAVYRRIVTDGHTLGMHSYSHNYSEIYSSVDSFQADMHKLQEFLYETTGVWTTYYRFPGGSSNTASKVRMQDLIDYLGRDHITYFDWNIYGGDDVDARTMVQNVTGNIASYSDAMILMHDASDKEETVEALPKIIEYIQNMDNTVIVPVTEDTVPVQHHKSNEK